jgi:uncharacterized membrane protein
VGFAALDIATATVTLASTKAGQTDQSVNLISGLSEFTAPKPTMLEI